MQTSSHCKPPLLPEGLWGFLPASPRAQKGIEDVLADFYGVKQNSRVSGAALSPGALQGTQETWPESSWHSGNLAPQGLRDGTWELVLKDKSVCGAGRALRVTWWDSRPGGRPASYSVHLFVR